MVLSIPGIAKAQDIGAFTEAPSSPLAYTATPAQLVLTCAALHDAGPDNLTVLSTTEVAAIEEVPAHCRIDGLMAPEIRVQYNFPDQWNRCF